VFLLVPRFQVSKRLGNYCAQYRLATVFFSGLVVIVLAIGPKFTGSNLAEGDGFLRAIKIRSSPSFEVKAKLVAPCRKVKCNVGV
jgi:hypothetical protein